MADEDDRLPLGLERADDREQLLRLLRREDGRGLVEDEDLRSPVEGLQDLDPLLHPHGDGVDPGLGTDGEAETLRELPDALLRSIEIEERPAVRLDAEHDVLGHRHHGDEHEVLVDHADAVVDRHVGRVDAQGSPVQADLALVRVVEAVEDAHERRLARPVLAEERVHLALDEVEVDVVVRDDAGEPLRDAAQLEKGRIRHGRRVEGRAWARPSSRLTIRRSTAGRSRR